MPKDDKKESYEALRVDSYSDKNDIKKAYKKLALQCHPDKNIGEGSSKKQFEEISKAFESLVLEGANDAIKDNDKIFFDFLGEILFGSDSNSDFFSFFCGSKQHCCSSSDGDPDFRVYQDDDDEEDIDGESELDSIMEIVKNRRKKGKLVPDNFHETKILELKNMLSQHKEEMRKDGSKKQQASKKGKTPVPVAKPKPKSKKQLLAEQRRRAKEMEQIAMELEEKRKEDEEKDKQRKQMEVERQKRLEEERIKSQNEERKKRERELKEREKQQRQEQEKEERRRRQQEEEKKRKEDEEKRKKSEKEKSDREKAARKAALQAAKEKDEQAKAANKLQSIKRQPQQQRTDQQQYPREIPPRFQKMKKQHMQQQSQSTQFQSNPQTLQQQNRVQGKPQPTVGKKKDPNRFASKEYAGLINDVDDTGWPKGQTRGSGWVGPTEDWEQDTEKWGAVDRDWGGKEGGCQQVIDRSDGESWPAVGNKTTGETLLTNSDLVKISKSSTPTSGSLVNSAVSLPLSLPLDSKSRNVLSNSLNNQQSSSTKAPDWSGNSNTGSLTLGTDTWDSACDDSIDRALDAVDSKVGVVGPVGPGSVGWGGMGTRGLGGLIGTPLGWDAAMNSKIDTSGSTVKQGWVSESSSAPTIDSLSWNKTPGKAPKTKTPNEVLNNKPVVTSTSTWGGTPADISSAWVEKSEKLKNMDKSNTHSTWDPKSNPSSNSQAQTSFAKKQTVDSSVEKTQEDDETTGWDETASKPSWGAKTSEITGTACWDSALGSAPRKVTETKENKINQDRGSGWLEGGTPGSSGTEWNEGNASKDDDENAEGSWDGWTTASSKRNRAPKPAPSATDSNASNAWMSRSLKQLLDMGFKQEDADKALRANHMNIESAIGDLLSMAASNSEQSQTASSSTANTPGEPGSLENSQQPPVKQNRKQRRKTQQQQQQQQQQLQNSIASQQVDTQDMETSTNTTVDSNIQEKTDTTKSISSEAQPTLTNSSQQPNDKSKTIIVLDPSNQQPSSKSLGTPGLVGTNPKRSTTGLMQPPTPGVPTPLRSHISHPLLQQQQLMQQYHLQLRMAQGGLLQSPVTPQQFALFQQMAQLRMVRQGLAQQQLNQKHNPLNPQAQQQLYQQQQQIALMLAQIQQQLLQQQPSGTRFPSPPFPATGQTPQPPTTTGNSQQQQQTSGNSVPTDKSNETPPSTTEGGIIEVSQAKDITPVSTITLEERGKQTSPAPQSRLTQWKQPLLPDPDQLPMTNDIQGSQWSSGGLRSDPNPNISPRVNRISESVSSRWGVDASLKLSADPPEFKPGVPWRSRKDGEVSPKGESACLIGTSSPVSPSKQSSRGSGFNETSLSNPSQYSFGLGSSPWQSTGPNDSLLTKPPSSSIRPPPGLDSQNALPETPSLEDEHSSWVKNLIDTASPRFGNNGPQNDFKFGQLSFPLTGTSWSTQDGQPLTAPDPKPWAAPGGPSPIATPSTVPMPTSVGAVSGTVNAIPSAEMSKAPNMGISSWSVKQPIPSAEEKLSHPSVTSESRPMLPTDTVAGSGNAKSATGSLSTWLVLRNIPQRADINAIRSVCSQYGQLLTFQHNMRYGNSLIRYGSKDQAASARNVLNGTMVQGGQLAADFATDGDIAGFFEQPVDWSTSPFPSNSTFGNHWSFQNIIGSGSGPGETSSAAPGMQRPTSNPDQGIPSEDKPTTSIPPMTGGPPPNMQWGNSGPAHVPSQLWGAPMPGTNTGFSSQVPSMWSFGTSANNEGPPQPGASDNGLVSPSMATFLPPGLLNGGESV